MVKSCGAGGDTRQMYLASCLSYNPSVINQSNAHQRLSRGTWLPASVVPLGWAREGLIVVQVGGGVGTQVREQRPLRGCE